MLDLVSSEQLRQPSPWELEQYRAAPKTERRGWEDIIDAARFCYADDDAQKNLENTLRRRDNALWCGSPASPATTVNISEVVRQEWHFVRNMFSWFRADTRTESGGKVTAFQDKVLSGVGARIIDANHALTQANTAFQPNASATNASWNNQLVSFFPGTGVAWMRSTLTAADWGFISNGTGGHFWLVCSFLDSAVTRVASTTRSAGNGVTFYRPVASNQLVFFQTNGSGAVVPNNPANSTSPLMASYKYKDGDTPEYVVRGVSAVGSGQLAGSASSSGTPELSLTLGFDNPANGYAGSFSDILASTNPSTALATLVDRYLRLRYSLPTAP